MKRLFCVWMVMAWIAPHILGQATTGTLVGTIADQDKARLRGIDVTAVNVDTNLARSTSTNDSGNYFISNLPVGLYRVEAMAAGFRKETRTILVQLNDQMRLDLTLDVGALTETLEITTDALLVQTDDPAIGAVITQGKTAALPLNGRQFESLVQLLPGVVTPAPGSHLSSRGGFNVAGLDEHYNSFFLDGIDNVDPVIRNFSFRPPLDLIQEFRVYESGYNAEFGRNAGAVINVITKSGSNAFRGTVWHYLRNDNLDARNFFAPSEAEKPPLLRNQFGITVGGPIQRNKTFFFAAYEGLRLKAGLTRRASVPTERMRSGDFSEFGTAIRDPISGVLFQGNIIPPARIDAVATETLQAFPLPNRNGSANRTETANRIENGNDVSIRIDHELGSSSRITGRYSSGVTRVLDPFRTETSAGVNLSNFGQTADRLRKNVGISIIAARGPKFMNELRAGYNRFNQPLIPLNSGTPSQQPLMGYLKTFLNFNIVGLTPLGSGPAFKRVVNVYNYIDSLSYISGNHQWKIGIDARRYLFNSWIVAPNAFVFDGSRSGHPFADFLLGLPTFATSTTGSPGGNARKTELSWYVQDAWQASPRLTIHYGLRWDFYGRIREKINKQSMWVSDCNCIKLAGAGLPPQLVDDDWNNFAPRLGMAWRPFSSKSVLRASAGIYYDNDMRHNSEFINNPPFVYNRDYFAALIPSLSFDNVFAPATGVSTLNPSALDRRYRDTYVEQWNLSLEREIARTLVVEVAYIGNHMLKARTARNVNQRSNGVTPYSGFGRIFLFEQSGSSAYHSLQIRVERDVASLDFVSSYTLGHAIDNRAGQGGGRIQNNDDMRGERGDADFDARHRWSFSTRMAVPFGKGRRWGNQSGRLTAALFSDWDVTGISIIQGGRPFTVYLAQDNSGSGNLNDRPNVVPGVDWRPSNPTPDHWINPSAFSIPTRGTFGNLGRNTLRGPQFHNLDLAFTKTIPMNERGQLQFRVEFFNVFNHPNFSLPNATLDATGSAAGMASFGVTPSTISPERQVQFGLRWKMGP